MHAPVAGVVRATIYQKHSFQFFVLSLPIAWILPEATALVAVVTSPQMDFALVANALTSLRSPSVSDCTQPSFLTSPT